MSFQLKRLIGVFSVLALPLVALGLGLSYASSINVAGAASIIPKINEFDAGTGATPHNSEFIEFIGTPNSDYNRYSVLAVEGTITTSYGVVVHQYNLGFANAEGYGDSGALSDVLTGTMTLLMVQSWSGGIGTDLDTNDDGTFDVTPWAALVDEVAFTTGDVADITYGSVVLPAGVTGASRIPDGTDTDTAGDWTSNATARTTQGAENLLQSATLDPIINEFVAGSFVEIYGDPTENYSNATILVVEGAHSSGLGVVTQTIAVGTTNANGYDDPNLASITAGTFTLLLVDGFSGSVGTDLDTNDDGSIDVTPWTAIYDDVAVTDGGEGNLTTFYSTSLLNITAASRLPNGSDSDQDTDWTANGGSLSTAATTRAAENSLNIAAPPSTPPMINEFVIHDTSANNYEYVELYGEADSTYSSYSLISIQGDVTTTLPVTIPSYGVINFVSSLDRTDDNGYFILDGLGSMPQNDTTTLYLVENFTGSLNDDLDTDNDGTLDITPWTSIADEIAISNEHISATVYTTSTNVLTGTAALAASRLPNATDTDMATDWTAGNTDNVYDTGEAANTPSITNTLAAAPPAAYINEFMFDFTGTGNYEFVELYGGAEYDYSLYTILAINGDITPTMSITPPQGIIEQALPMGTTDSNGFFANNYLGDVFTADTTTLLLVRNFSGSAGDDLDTNNDGTFDSTPWESIEDEIAVSNGDISATVYTTATNVITAAGASRLPDGTDTNLAADWTNNNVDDTFNSGEAANTPGATNVLATAPVPLSPVINEIAVDHGKQGAFEESYEYIELYGEPNTDYSNLTIVVIDTDALGAPTGVIDNAFTVGTTDANGIWDTGFLPEASLGDLGGSVFSYYSVGLFLVEDFSGSVGTDLDTDDNDLFDSQPWTSILDSVLIRRGQADAGPNYFGAQTILNDSYNFESQAWSRLPNGTDTNSASDWTRNDPDGYGIAALVGTPGSAHAKNTPGETNIFAPSLTINEFVFDHLGSTDNYEFIEISGEPNLNLANANIVLVDSNVTNLGEITHVFTPTTLDANGYWDTGYLTADTIDNSSVSIFLVAGFTGAVGTDIDTNDDGIIDNPAWSLTVDDISVIDGDSGDISYASVTLLPSLSSGSTTVGGASRIPDGTDTDMINDWVRNDFDGAGIPALDPGTPDIGEANNTKGAANTLAFPTITEPIINEFVFDHIGTDTYEFIEIAGLPSTDYSRYSILMVDGAITVTGAITPQGVISYVFPIGVTNSDGVYAIPYQSETFDFDSVTVMIVEGNAGVVGDDIDSNNDGTIDTTYWTSIVDDVAIRNSNTVSNAVYSSVVLDPSFGSGGGIPASASRIPHGIDTDSTSDWNENDFDGFGLPGLNGTPSLTEAKNTPNEINILPTDPEWLGYTDSWNTPTNWSTGAVPNSADDVLIPAAPIGGNMPILDVNAATNRLEIEAGASIDLSLYTMTVEDELINYGTLSQTLTVSGATEFLQIRNSGDTADKYRGLNITPSGAMGEVRVAIMGNQSACGDGSDAHIKRCFSISPTTDQPATVRFYYEATELNGQPANELKTLFYEDSPASGASTTATYSQSESTTTCASAFCWFQANAITNYDKLITGGLFDPIFIWAGYTTDWNTASNWISGTVPTSLDDVTIPSAPVGGNMPVLASHVTINNLTMEGGTTLDIAGYDLAITTNFEHSGELALATADSVAVAGDFTNNGVLTLNNGTSVLTVEGTLTNNGTIQQTRSIPTSSATELPKITNSAGSTTKFLGTIINPTGNMGDVTVIVRAGGCSSDGDDYQFNQCFEINPTTDQTADITFLVPLATGAPSPITSWRNNPAVWYYDNPGWSGASSTNSYLDTEYYIGGSYFAYQTDASAVTQYNSQFLIGALTDQPGGTTPTYYTLSTSTSGNSTGLINANPTGLTQPEGTEFILSAAPDANTVFSGWSGDIVSSDNPLVFNLTADTSIQAEFNLITYPLNTYTDGSGSGTIGRSPNAATYDHGTNVTLTANPTTGSAFSGWSGSVTGNTNPVVVTIEEAKNITATFTLITYTVGSSTAGNGVGTVEQSVPAGSYDYGTSVTFTATVGANSVFQGWSGTASGSTNPLTLSVDENENVIANFALVTYTLDTATDGNGSGSISRDPNAATYDHGTVVTLTANIDTGSIFSGWSGAVSGTTSPITVTMDQAREVTATFTLITYTVDTFTDGNGSGSVTKDPNTAVYDYGTVVTLTASTNTGSVFSGWSGDASGSTTPVTLTVDSNKEVTGTFTLITYTLDTFTDGNGSGSVSKDPNTAVYDYGTVVTLTASANTGSVFSGWSGDASGSTTPVTITVDSNKAVTGTFTLITYTLDTFTDGNGSGSVTKDPNTSVYDYGTIVTLTASANTGSVFHGWSGDASGSTNPVTITIDSDKAVTGTFTLITYTLDTFTDGNGSGSVGKEPNTAAYNYGTVVTLTASANTGSVFHGWSGDGSGLTTPITITIDSDKAVTATFTLITYTLDTFTTGNGSGSVSKDPNTAVYDYGTVVTLTASANTGSEFTNWSGDASGSTNPITVTIDSNKAVTATFSLITYTLDTFTDGNGSGSVGKEPNTAVYDYGSVVTLTASANTGSVFHGWSGDASGLTTPVTVTIDSDKAVTATFTLITYTLDTFTDGNGSGSVSKDPNTAVYDYGTVVTLTASANTGSIFSGWSGDASGSTTPVTVTIDSDKAVTGTFTLITYTLDTFTDGNGSGSVSKDPNTAVYDYGTVVTLTASANIGSVFSGWSGDASGTTTPVTVTVDSNKAVTATFTLITYTLDTFTAGTGSGSISKDPNTAVYDYGTVVTLTASASTGSDFTSWSGDTSGTTNPMTITMNSDKTVTATFTLQNYPFTIVQSGNGSGAVVQDPVGATADYGTVITLTATASTGSYFDGWSGSLISSTNPITVFVDGPKTITATFTLTTYGFIVGTDGNGSGAVLQDPAGTPVDHGSVITLTAQPSTGSIFSGWSGSVVSTTNPLNVTVEQAQEITATFTLITYTLDTFTTGSGSGSISVDPNQTVYDYGTVVTLTATADPGSEFISWGGDASGSTYSTTVTIDSDKAVTATIDLITYTLSTYTAGDGQGTITVDPDQASYTYGTVVTLTATAEPYSNFTGWSGAVTSTAPTITVTITESQAITATFTRETFFTFLPLMATTAYPDLVIDSLTVTGNNTVEIQITNNGQAPVLDEFWVDLYIGLLNPTNPPTSEDDIWEDFSPNGAAWGVTGNALPLNPGESLTLTTNGAYYSTGGSNLPGTIEAGTAMYAQVDSANADSAAGGVVEAHEASGDSYNNIFGPVFR